MEEEEEFLNTIVESRKELMISSSGQETPILRTALFLKPSLTSNFEESCNFSSISPASLVPTTVDRKKWPLTVNFKGWRDPPKEWKEWVRKMASLHEPTWKKASIHEAIFNSTYKFHKHCDLIVGFAERWCPETNSFLLPWGEATVTLEDMMISGFSVLGCPVFKPLETEELKEIEKKLNRARKEILKSSAKKACQYSWLKKFMDSGSELEHEAFLSLWLSRFVLPTSFNVISECVFPIAVHLARGTRIALAPAVLANIYSDLTLLKGKIVSLASLAVNARNENVNQSETVVTAWSPFQLVQVWVWERFIKLSPNPNVIKNGEPRLARWNNLKCKVENVRLVLESCKQSFIWRPYTKAVVNWSFPKFYTEKELWVSINAGLDEELESFIRCLRVSELVGLGADCIEQYLPHRVARQFGIDQDVPGFVARSDGNREDAWNCYNRPISDAKCYLPSQFFETDVTTRYLEWWKHSVQDLQGVSKSPLGNFRKKSETLHQSLKKKIIENDKSAKSLTEINNLLVPPGFSPKCKRTEAGDSSEEDDLTIDQLLKCRKKHHVENEHNENDRNLLGKQRSHLIAEEEVRETSVLATSMERIPQSEHVIHSSPTDTIIYLTLEEDLKFNEAAVGDGQNGHEKNDSDPSAILLSSSEDDEAQGVEILKFDKAATRQDGDGKNASGQLYKCQSPSSSTADSEALEVLDTVTSMEKVALNAAAEKRQDRGEISADLLGQSQAKTSEGQPISSESPMLTETGRPKQEVEQAKKASDGGTKEGTSGYSLDDPIKKLEDRLRRLETEFADYKAMVSSRMHA